MLKGKMKQFLIIVLAGMITLGSVNVAAIQKLVV